MKKYLNQRGYALLIVLMTIIIFLSVSTVFISASLNHVTQEKAVDANNQAVVAAEMGVKHYSYDLINKIKNIQNRIVDEYPNYTECNKNGNCYCNMVSLDSSIKDKNLIVDNLNICYFSKIDKLIMEINVDNTEYTQKKVIANSPSELYYKIKPPIVIKPVTDGKILEFIINGSNVIGNTPSAKSSDLTAQLKVGKINLESLSNGIESISNVNQALDTTKIFRNPPSKKCSALTKQEVNNSLDRIECLVGKNEQYLDLINTWNSNGFNKNKIKLYFNDYMSVCKNNCNNPDIDISRDTVLYFESLYLENTNNRSPFKAIVNGNYNMYQANSFGDNSGDTLILAKSFSANSPSINRTTIIISGEDSKKTIQFDIVSLNISSNSKVCLNVDKMDLRSIDNIYTKISGTGNLIILRTNQAIHPFDKTKITNVSNFSLLSDPQKFATDCGLQEMGFKEVFILNGPINQANLSNVFY